MFFYWFLYLSTAFFALTPIQKNKVLNQFIWITLLTLIILTIGCREKIGGDWLAYSKWFEFSTRNSFVDVLSRSDYGYMIINWIIAQLNGNIYIVNLICGLLFTIGLAKFCSSLALPWLALACSIPYVVIVIAMGYTRQSIALGFLFYAFSTLRPHRFFPYIFIIILGSFFHKTVVVMILPVVYELRKKLNFINWTWLLILLVFSLCLFFDYCQSKWNAYVVQNMQSAGGFFRALMATFPVILTIIYRKSIWKTLENKDVWQSIAITVLASPALALLSSTTTDRLLIYTFPLQLLCWTELARNYSTQNARFIATAGILFYHGITLYLWLNFAVHRHSWVPYQNIIF